MKDKKEIKFLIGKYLNNQASLYEISKLDAWLEEDPEIIAWLSDMIEQSDDTVSPDVAMRLNRIFNNDRISESADRDPVIETPSSSKGKMKHILWGMAAAVAAIMACGMVFLLPEYNHREETPLIVSTAAGERSHVQLPDGTRIALNHNSKISYTNDKGGKSRNINLEGEAYFDVTTDPDHPFIVTCDGLSIECKGTSFNVKGYPEESEVTAVLADGIISANADMQTVTMKPGTKVSYDKSSHNLQSSMVEVSDYTCWTAGECRFNDDRLEDILHSVSRRFGVEINIVTPTLKEIRLSGSIGNKTLSETLALLASASGSTYFTESDSTICFYRKAAE